MQRPSNVMKINEVDKAQYFNSETYINYLSRLMLMITSLFKWDNLPNNIPERYIEKVLFEEGKIAFVNSSEFGLITTKCTQYSALNIYAEPLAWLCYSDNGFMEDYKTDDIEIIRNNKYCYPTRQLIEHHLQRLTNIEVTIDKNLWYQRNLAIIKSTDETRLTTSNIIDQYDNNSFIIYGKKDLELKDNIEKLDFDIPFIADKLEDIKERKWNELINMLGINSANTQKKERLITDEANANNQLINLSVDIMLAERQQAVERINKRWGLNINVNLRNKNEQEGGVENE
jgi:hypothetical protein